MSVSPARLAAEADLGACPAADPFSLADANINPVTGLSTDYLNHFNEAIMLLEMLPVMPECRADLAGWQPLSYHEHFAASHLKHRELAMAAYGLADAATRSPFDELCEAMNAAVVAAREAMRPPLAAQIAAAIAAEAAAWLKPLVARASALIHGSDLDGGRTASVADWQAAIDAVIERHGA
jgi:hypothetical protein